MRSFLRLKDHAVIPCLSSITGRVLPYAACPFGGAPCPCLGVFGVGLLEPARIDFRQGCLAICAARRCYTARVSLALTRRNFSAATRRELVPLQSGNRRSNQSSSDDGRFCRSAQPNLLG